MSHPWKTMTSDQSQALWAIFFVLFTLGVAWCCCVRSPHQEDNSSSTDSNSSTGSDAAGSRNDVVRTSHPVGDTVAWPPDIGMQPPPSYESLMEQGLIKPPDSTPAAVVAVSSRIWWENYVPWSKYDPQEGTPLLITTECKKIRHIAFKKKGLLCGQ